MDIVRQVDHGQPEACSASLVDAIPKPEVGIRELVVRNLNRLRSPRSMSLPALVARSHVSYLTLQVTELGRALPGLAVPWRVSPAPGIPRDVFVETPEPAVGGRISPRLPAGAFLHLGAGCRMDPPVALSLAF